MANIKNMINDRWNKLYYNIYGEPIHYSIGRIDVSIETPIENAKVFAENLYRKDHTYVKETLKTIDEKYYIFLPLHNMAYCDEFVDCGQYRIYWTVDI
jgi:uncharacterized membrane protein